MKQKTIKTKIVGVSHQNPDGSSRQQIIKKHVRPRRPLRLLREPDNPHSPDGTATSVWITRKRWFATRHYCIGYLASHISEEVAPLLDAGWQPAVVVLTTPGGTRAKPTRGVNIKIELQPPNKKTAVN